MKKQPTRGFRRGNSSFPYSILRSLSAFAISTGCIMGIGYPSIYAQQPIQTGTGSGTFTQQPIVQSAYGPAFPQSVVPGCNLCPQGVVQPYGQLLPPLQSGPVYYPSTPVYGEFIGNSVPSSVAPHSYPAVYSNAYPSVIPNQIVNSLPLQNEYSVGEVISAGEGLAAPYYDDVQPPVSDPTIPFESTEGSSASEYPIVPLEGPYYGALNMPGEVVVSDGTVMPSPSDIVYSETNNSAAAAEAAAKLREALERSQAEVEDLKTVVAELKVDLKSANAQVYATKRDASAAKKMAQADVEVLKKKVYQLSNSLTEKTQEAREIEVLMKKSQSERARFKSDLARANAKLEEIRQMNRVNSKESDALAAKAKRLLLEKEASLKQVSSYNKQLAELKLVTSRMGKENSDLKAEIAALTEKLAEKDRTAKKSDRSADADSKSKPKSDAAERYRRLMSEAEENKKKHSSRDGADRKRQPRGKMDSKRDAGDKHEHADSKETSDREKSKAPMRRPQFDANAQIKKLSQSMDRQIAVVEDRINQKLKQKLEELGEEGVGKDHPRAVRLKAELTRELDREVKKIKERVRQRIERIRREAARRRAS